MQISIIYAIVPRDRRTRQQRFNRGIILLRGLPLAEGPAGHAATVGGVPRARIEVNGAVVVSNRTLKTTEVREGEFRVHHIIMG